MPARAHIAPSLMCADFLRLGEDLDTLADGGCTWWHVDIMDGHYVPNLTLGPDFCRALKRHNRLPMDIHLMVEPVEQHVGRFLEFTGSRISFHPETARHPLAVIQQIRSAGCIPGIAISPAIAVASLAELLPEVDYVCVMTVNPGFAGQKLIPSCLKKITEVKAFYDSLGLSKTIEVDGNVSWANIPPMVRAGADLLVAGTSSIFVKEPPLRENLVRLNALLDELACEN